jgi:hypothetical protein
VRRTGARERDQGVLALVRVRNGDGRRGAPGQGQGAQGVGKVVPAVTGKVATCFRARTAAGPRIMAGLCNLVITMLRLAGATNIAAALRYHARRSSRPLQTITKC